MKVFIENLKWFLVIVARHQCLWSPLSCFVQGFQNGKFSLSSKFCSLLLSSCRKLLKVMTHCRGRECMHAFLGQFSHSLDGQILIFTDIWKRERCTSYQLSNSRNCLTPGYRYCCLIFLPFSSNSYLQNWDFESETAFSLGSFILFERLLGIFTTNIIETFWSVAVSTWWIAAFGLHLLRTLSWRRSGSGCACGHWEPPIQSEQSWNSKIVLRAWPWSPLIFVHSSGPWILSDVPLHEIDTEITRRECAIEGFWCTSEKQCQTKTNSMFVGKKK